VIVVSRFDAPGGGSDDLLPLLEAALDALAVRPGYVRGRIGRSVDEPSLWLLTTEWTDVGAYRRSLSSYEVKVATAALFALARPEPSAFELLAVHDEQQPDAATPSSRARGDG
jgi:quinol monooxygenase YgiN